MFLVYVIPLPSPLRALQTTLTNPPPSPLSNLNRVQRCFHSTLSTRTILKLRQMARRDLELSTFMRQFELCCDEEQQVCLSGLVGSSDSEVVQPVRGERGGGGEGEGPSSRAPLALGSSTTALVAVSEFGPAPSLDIDSEPPTTNAPRLPLAVAWANDHTVTTHCTPTSRPGSSGPSGPQFTKEQHDFIADGPDVRSIASRTRTIDIGDGGGEYKYKYE
ncbi:hypothetical protein CC1G_06156 [Coprinopsis cinerea okayama7|uniref:Uncharacterized protein n=1 Tax=Coprinopsis cinerea (strain Okayama-7 / 130 / ATCC MYA-4618 / FGSC 9003) TaxID=240176 RepID=A8PAD2_COPC7|nr:hypothetical protein CC1G_06156 [Coprinopsis cinerea okayama7\|eukprot:XP_001839966.2 hypothetical protein CC1G_06156 [Coprinopsis cinerea okayama7\